VRGSQLEQCVKDDAASDHEMWIWLLKLHLGTIYWESGQPLERTRRSALSRLSIVPNEGLDLGFFRRVFSAYKGRRSVRAEAAGHRVDVRCE
jgi:hypothetical protein